MCDRLCLASFTWWTLLFNVLDYILLETWFPAYKYSPHFLSILATPSSVRLPNGQKWCFSGPLPLVFSFCRLIQGVLICCHNYYCMVWLLLNLHLKISCPSAGWISPLGYTGPLFNIPNTKFQETFLISCVWTEFLSLSFQGIQYIAETCHHFIKYGILIACLLGSLVYFFHETKHLGVRDCSQLYPECLV